MDEILPRFTSMLLNVLSKLAGPKGLEIKVGGEGGKGYVFSCSIK